MLHIISGMIWNAAFVIYNFQKSPGDCVFYTSQPAGGDATYPAMLPHQRDVTPAVLTEESQYSAMPKVILTQKGGALIFSAIAICCPGKIGKRRFSIV